MPIDFSKYQKKEIITKPPKTLKPPKKIIQEKPKIIPEISQEIINSKIESSGIDLVKLANSSDFKRLIYLALTGKTWRGKDADLERKLNTHITVFRDPSFSNVLNEMKANFKNGFIKPSQMNK